MSVWWILFAIGFLLLASMAYAAASGAPWVPTHKRDFDRFIDLVDPQSGEKLYELGAGSARLSREIARRCGVEAVGVELSLFQVLIGKWLSRNNSNVEIRWANMFNVDLSDADIMYLFLIPETYERLAEKLQSEMRPGSKVVSYVWPVPGLEVAAESEKDGSANLYVHEI
jgi:SAM-dependent methyltransferase